jgi:ribonuclease R
LAPGRAFGPRRGTVLERLGASDDPRNLTLIAIHTHGIPTRFSEAALAEAKAVGLEDLGPRADWRHLPMIAIDPGDARDRDDLVWAESDPDLPGGWLVVVAIADVAHYVRPGGALDRAARERGNSTYFPDRAVPMLPEALSGDLCSFKANRDCPTLAVRLWFDAAGRKRRHEFVRALVRPVATLEYGQVQRTPP